MIEKNFSNLKYYWSVYKKNIVENPFYEIYLYEQLIISIIKFKGVIIEKGIFKLAYDHFIVMYLLCFAVVWLLIVLVAAVLTADERKVIATIQLRHGPARVGYGGWLQPIADAIKMILKEFIEVRHVKGLVFKHSALLSFFFASFFWLVLPYNGDFTILNSNFSILFIILISLLHAYCILTAGWSSNSKYGFLGAIRTVCQLISYDIVVIFVFINIYLNYKSIDLFNIAKDQYILGSNLKFMPLIFVTFIVASLAESNRHPYDLPEAEAESVAGYNVEYSSIRFAMFFLAEYASVAYTSVLITLIFLNPEYNYNLDFISELLKVLFVIFFIISLRALLPRYRYDQLMRSCWKSHIPVNCAIFLFSLVMQVIL